MAYIGLVDYDEGGRIQSLDGAVTYDNGATRNLLGKVLSAVKYDDGGRFRTLVGLGQDPSLDMTDLPLAPSSTDIPLNYAPLTPSPTFDTISVPVTGTLVDTTPPATPFIYTPSPTVDTVATQAAGTLVDTTPAAVAPAVQSIVPSVLTSIFSGVKSIFGSTSSTVKPAGTGTIVGTVPATSWFSQDTVVSGLPNWAVLAGAGLAAVVVLASVGGSGGSRRRRNPSSRRNPAELILMGANPWRGPARRRRMR
jgi:hypothetical protein